MRHLFTLHLCKTGTAIKTENIPSLETAGVCVDCRGKFAAQDCMVCWDCAYARYERETVCA